MESKHEYLENVSRRNNDKILGLPQFKLKEKSWDDTEELVKGVIKEKFKFDTEVKLKGLIMSGSQVLHLKSWKMVQGRKFGPVPIACWK